MADVRDANNFYENYAESTKGKRRVEDFDGHFGASSADQVKEVPVSVASSTTTKGGDGEMKKVGSPTITVQEI